MTPEEMEALRRRCAPPAGDGHLELGREQHGLPSQKYTPLSI
jgi:hypothetical protein